MKVYDLTKEAIVVNMEHMIVHDMSGASHWRTPEHFANHLVRYVSKWQKATLYIPIPPYISTCDKPDRLGKVHAHKPNLEVTINQKIYTRQEVSDDSTVYIHPACKVPRNRITEKYKKKLKPEDADFCVIPSKTKLHALDKLWETEKVAIFEGERYLYVVLPSFVTIGTKMDYAWNEGTGLNLKKSFKDTYPILYSPLDDSGLHSWYGGVPEIRERYKDIMDATLVFTGNAISIHKDYQYLGDIINNKLHDLVYEDDLLANTNNEENAFTNEARASIREMLLSRDLTIVGLGMKMLAELDYVKYANSIAQLLNETNSNWGGMSITWPSSVKFMLDKLNYRYGAFSYLDTITKEDYALLEDVVNDTITKKADGALKSLRNMFKFADIEFYYEFKVKPKHGQS